MNQIVINVKDGVVQSVVTSEDINVLVLDHDPDDQDNPLEYTLREKEYSAEVMSPEIDLNPEEAALVFFQYSESMSQ